MKVVREESREGQSVLHVAGALRAPLNGDLRRRVGTLLDRGVRSILLDIGRVGELDAAGLGELVRLHTMAGAVKGTLRVRHATGKVRTLLALSGLCELLGTDGPC